MSSSPLIDASVFMGMHAQDDDTRLACMSFMAARFDTGVVLSWEQIGRCDDIVWSYARDVQDAYYPFMDILHSTMSVARRPYDGADLELALRDRRLVGLPMHEALSVAMASNRNASLVTISERLHERCGLPVRHPVGRPGVNFPEPVATLYIQSLRLRVDGGEL
jgi:uncharacterized protein DUF6190